MANKRLDIADPYYQSHIDGYLFVGDLHAANITGTISGGTVTGDLEVTGDLTVDGTIINTDLSNTFITINGPFGLISFI